MFLHKEADCEHWICRAPTTGAPLLLCREDGRDTDRNIGLDTDGTIDCIWISSKDLVLTLKDACEALERVVYQGWQIWWRCAYVEIPRGGDFKLKGADPCVVYKKRWTMLNIRKSILLKLCTITGLWKDKLSCTQKQMANTEYEDHRSLEFLYHRTACLKISQCLNCTHFQEKNSIP